MSELSAPTLTRNTACLAVYLCTDAAAMCLGGQCVLGPGNVDF